MITPQQIKYFEGYKEHLYNKIRSLKREEEVYDEDNEDEIEGVKRDLMKLQFREKAYYATDLIQPDDNRFKEVYRKQWLEREKEKEMAELKKKRIKKEQEQFLKDNRHGLHADEAKKFINLEDKIRHGN